MGKRFCGVYIDHIFEFIISTLQKIKCEYKYLIILSI